MTNTQNKAHQTVAVMGCADNPLGNGLSNGSIQCYECVVIVNQFSSKQQDSGDQFEFSHHKRTPEKNTACTVYGAFNGVMHRCGCVNIAKNLVKLSINSQKQSKRHGWMGHNGGSLNSWQHPASVLRFFSSPFMAMRPLARTLSAMAGVLGIRKNPAVHDGESTTATLFLGVVFKSQNRGGHHA